MEITKTKDIKLSVIKEMEILASRFPDAISLAQGIPSFDTPEVIKNFAIKAINKNLVSKYSLCPGLPELREVVSRVLIKDNMHYSAEKEIIITVGAIEAITSSLLTILSQGDEVLMPTPTYVSYSEAIKVAGGKPVSVPLKEESGWGLNLEEIERKITEKSRVIFFCNPNNPTSTIYKKEEIKKIEELALKYNLFIITDEVYKDFIYDDEISFYSPAQNPKLKDRVIRVFSFSKAFAMTGWRIGFIHSSENNIKEILKVHDAMVTCAPVVSQYAAIAAFEMADSAVDFHRLEFIKRRELIMKKLLNLSDFFSFQKPNSAYFVFPKILKSKLSSYEFSLDLLNKAKVAVVPGVAFGEGGEGHIRISFGVTEEKIIQAFERIEQYLRG